MDRRTFLQRLLHLASLSVYGHVLAAPSENRTGQFRLGVASGSPTPDGVTLWTRLIADVPMTEPLPVIWQVARDASFKNIVASGRVLALPELAHSVHVDVEGLQADRWYWYRFIAGNATSPVGRTRTLPAPAAQDVERLRFAYASCQRWQDGYYAAYRHMRNEDLDLVVFVGDYIYEKRVKSPRVRDLDLPTARGLNAYRARYAAYKSDPYLQQMHAACPWIVTWDDHEVENNYAGEISVESPKGHAQRRIAAYQAYYEHMPLSLRALTNGIDGLSGPNALRIYDRYHFGRLATFHVLDDRQYRSLPLCPRTPGKYDYPCASQDAHDRTILGLEQEQWLDQGLHESAQRKTQWDLIVQQTVFSPRRSRRAGQIVTPLDGWDGFAAARQRLIDSVVQRQPKNCVFIGGDIHQNWVAHVRRNPLDDNSPVIASEFCGTSITSNSGQTLKQADQRRPLNPHCIFNNPERRGYGVVEITKQRCRVTLRALEDVADPDSRIFTLAKFEVQSGNPQIKIR